MTWAKLIQNTLDYIEEHILEKISYENLANNAYSSSYHFQRMFGLVCGITIGEYIRKRRLTLAGFDLLNTKTKIIDVALRYGYETPESFTRAFANFHGITPSKAKKGGTLKSFSRLCIYENFSGGKIMKYKIEEKEEIVLIGYKKRFTGVPYGEERVKQEEKFFRSTRAKQWLLIGASCDYSTDYIIIDNVSDDGYDFYIAYQLDEWTRNAMYDKSITGVDFMEKMGFETITIPKRTYAIFETEKKKSPIADNTDIRNKIITEWLPSFGITLANTPEIVAMHWRPNGKWENERYIEMRLPIKK